MNILFYIQKNSVNIASLFRNVKFFIELKN